jgi:hypothetical protein
MPSEPKRTQAIDSKIFLSVAESLLDMSETAKKAAATADSQPEKTLAVYNWPSAQTGLARLKSFIDDVKTAMMLANTGSPRAVGELKPRSTAKKKPSVKGLREAQEKHRGTTNAPKRRKRS